MSTLSIAPIVEGHGEVIALRTMLDRIWRELLNQEYIETLRPIRRPRHKLLRLVDGKLAPDEEELGKAVRFAQQKLTQATRQDQRKLILLLIDADKDCPAEASPMIQQTIIRTTGIETIAVVLAKIEYESWFVASCISLAQYLDCTEISGSNDPETNSLGKTWIERRFRGPKYSETVDQVRLTAVMDLLICRERCPSFDKLCRELEAAASRS